MNGAWELTVGDGGVMFHAQLHCIEYDQDNEVIRCVNLYNHPHELWHLAPSLHHPDLLFTCYSTSAALLPPPIHPPLSWRGQSSLPDPSNVAGGPF